MDIKSAMTKFGFGHRNSRQIVIDSGGELWLAYAPVAAGGFLRFGATTNPGTMRIEPLKGGNPSPFTYTATEALLELAADNGDTIKIAIDRDANAVRIKGGAPFRLNGVSAGERISTLNTPGGVSLTIGAMRYFIVAKKGKITFDDSWILNKFRSVTPVLDVEPENGEFELYVFDLPEDTDVPPVTKTLDECAADSAADFIAFTDTLVDIPAEFTDVKERIAYPLWLCHRVVGDAEIIVKNKYNSADTNSKLMAIASMAFKDARKTVDMLTAYPVDLPPVAGVAASRLIGEGMLCDSRGEMYRVYAALESAATRCINERTTDGDGLSFYAYRYESGVDYSPEFFKVGEPVLAPDLNAYLVIVSEVIGKLARMEYDDGAARKWELRSKSLLVKLIAELWNGEEFVGKNAYSGETSGPDENLSLVPIILGSRLPDDIIRKLAPKIDGAATDSAVGLLLAGGLYDAGEKAAAAGIAKKALENVRADGLKCPFYGASLLALAHKTM